MQNIPANTLLWYCVKTRPRQEQVVKRKLQTDLGIQVFCPLLRFERGRRTGRVRVVEAMFPGYIFAKFSCDMHRRRIATTSGVSNLVSFGGVPAVVSPEIIHELQAAVADDEIIEISPSVQVGEEVQVLEGPFRGIRAVVTQVLPARTRVTILLELLGIEREVEVNERSVLPNVRHPLSMN